MKDLKKQNIEERLTTADKELNVLYEVSSAMRTTLELNHILYIILTGVTSHPGLGYNRAALFLVNPKERCLECKMVIGPESGEHASNIWKYIENSKQKLDDLIKAENISQTIEQSSLYKSLKKLLFSIDPDDPSLLTKAFHRGTPWHIPPQVIAQYAQDPLLKFFQTDELVIVPLRAKDSVNGLIVADNIYTRKPITGDEMKIFTMLADQAGLAIENSRLYEMVVQKSRTDSITNLWNHGFFQDKLTAEIEKAEKTHQPLSLAIIDIDNFKKLNDSYGHQQGDIILRELANIFKESSRDRDYICRYGGEEFSIVLIQTNKEQAMDIAERLRTKIAEHPFALQSSGPGKKKDLPDSSTGQAPPSQTPPLPAADQVMNITVSIGVGTFPDDALTKEDLITKSDKAMYMAKFSGKNRTCIAE